MSSSEFELYVEEQEQKSGQKLQDDLYGDNNYSAFEVDALMDEAKMVTKLQNLLKSSYLILQHEEKRKNEKVKEIQYAFTNAFNNYLLNSRAHQNVVIVNRSDILQISDHLSDQLESFQHTLFSIENLASFFNINSKPPTSFLQNFHNFYPRWNQHISSIIQMEIDNSPKIQSVFESEYTFPAKILSSLKYSHNIHRFCQEMFQKPLKELSNFNEELELDFYQLYDRWSQKLKQGQQLKYYELYRFIYHFHQEKETKKLKKQISELMGVSYSEAQKLVTEMIYFSTHRQAMNSLMKEMRLEELDEEGTNMKLLLLVWKKTVNNRKKVETILTLLIDQIINSFNIFPKQIKHIIRQYYKLTKKAYGQVKFEDIKSFFNKIIYSQLLFPQFMKLLEGEQNVDANVRNFNIPIIALLSQKIVFGQDFYQRANYIYFNQLITHYEPLIKDFMSNFLEDIHPIAECSKKDVNPALLNFQTIKYLYEQMKQKDYIKHLPALQKYICEQEKYQIGSSKYKRQQVYIVLINKKISNYLKVFKPEKKICKILFDFLISIEKIPQPIPLCVLLEQYKYTTDKKENTSIQLYANYLSLEIKSIQLEQIVNEVEGLINATKKKCMEVKIMLEKEFNFVQNQEKVFMEALKQKRARESLRSIKNFISCTFQEQTGFSYGVIEGKVCQLENQVTPTILKCLHDVANFYMKKIEGFDALYHWVLERVVDLVEGQGIVDEETVNAAKNLVGQELYKILQLNTKLSADDIQLFEQEKKHRFICLKMFDLGQYQEQEELILESTIPLLKKLQFPHSADELLLIFNKVTKAFSNIVLITGKPSDITSDFQISMMIFIIVKSQIPNLPTIIDFINHFCSEQVKSTVLGQTLTLVQSVLYIIQSMSPQTLNLTPEKYEELCSLEREAMEGESQRQYMVSFFDDKN